MRANIDEHLRLTRIAAGQDALLILFPELSLTGYELGLAGALAFSTVDSRLAPLIEAAESHAITLIVGAPVRLGQRLHVGAFIISPDGSVDLYTKHRLGAFSAAAGCDGIVPPAEATVFEAGDRNPLVRFGGHVAAVAVCSDIGNPAHARHAAERGAEIYLASMFIIPSDFEGETERLRNFAVRHSMAVALANFGGPTGGLTAGGRSTIWAQTGEVLVRLEAAGAGVAVATETDDGWQTARITVKAEELPRDAGVRPGER